MRKRPRYLPSGWYPGTADEISTMIDGWLGDLSGIQDGIAAIVPHAGWFFSGEIAARTISGLTRNLDTVVVAGGHLSPGDITKSASDEEFSVSGGGLLNNLELRSFISGRLELCDDDSHDNTVEIQLPMIKYFYNNVTVLWLRVPPDKTALKLAGILKTWSIESGERIGVIGSTDLTHYGNSYGWKPRGEGRSALDWVKGVNDREMLDFMIGIESLAAIDHARKNRSACSIGGAALAIEWAKLNGREKGRLVGYSTSFDKQPSDSFVGYGGILY